MGGVPEICGWISCLSPEADSKKHIPYTFLVYLITLPFLLHSKCSLYFKFIYLFIYLFLLCWVFVSVRGLSLVVASGGHSSLRCAGLSLSRPLLLWSTGFGRAGSVVVAHGPSCSAACGIFPDQGSNPCPLHWPADSQPLCHQGSPVQSLLKGSNESFPLQYTCLDRPLTPPSHFTSCARKVMLAQCHFMFCQHSPGPAASSKVHSTYFQIERLMGLSGVLLCCAEALLFGYVCPTSCN